MQNISVDAIISTLSLIGTFVALYYTFRKQKKEERHLDAETVDSVWETLDRAIAQNEKLEQRYKALQQEFADYKKVVIQQIAEMASESERLRNETEDLKHRYERQITTNREQGQKISQLKKDNQALKQRIRTLEEKLKELNGE